MEVGWLVRARPLRHPPSSPMYLYYLVVLVLCLVLGSFAESTPPSDGGVEDDKEKAAMPNMKLGTAPFSDPHAHFCHKDSCYEVLGLKRGAAKADIKRAYRQLSLLYHPDKSDGSTGLSRKESLDIFQRVSAGNKVLSSEETREKYDFYTDNPDAYWEEYGHWWVKEYSPPSDVKWVLLGLLLVVSIFQPLHQKNKHDRAVQYIVAAAENNYNVRQGGTPLTRQLRQQAEEELARRQKDATTAGGKSGSKRKAPKKTKAEQAKELNAIIRELASKVHIGGSNKKPTWRDNPLVKLPLIPLSMARLLFFLARWHLLKSRRNAMDYTFWSKRCIGADTWDDLDEEGRKSAVQEEVWKGSDELEAWKWKHLHGGDVAGLKQRKAFAAQRIKTAEEEAVVDE